MASELEPEKPPPDHRGFPDGLVVQAPTNQSWLALRTQVESADDLDNVHAIQDSYTVTPLSMYGKHYEAPLGVVNPNIQTDRGPSPQANAFNGEQFFTKASEWFNKVPFPDTDKAVGMETALAQLGIKHGQPFVYASLSPEVKNALEVATKQVQQEFAKLAEKPAALGGLKNGWVIQSPATGSYGTDYRLRAAIAFVGFGANLTVDALYPLLVQDSNG